MNVKEQGKVRRPWRERYRSFPEISSASPPRRRKATEIAGKNIKNQVSRKTANRIFLPRLGSFRLQRQVGNRLPEGISRRTSYIQDPRSRQFYQRKMLTRHLLYAVPITLF